MYTVGLEQLQPIFQDPSSIKAFEVFHDAVHRASDSLLTSLALQLQASLASAPSQEHSYQSNPLYIILLIKRFLTHTAAAPSLPPTAHLPHLYFHTLLPVFFKLSQHPQEHAISVQLVPCLALLAGRLLKLPHTPDPFAELMGHLSTFSFTLHDRRHQPLEHFDSAQNSFRIVKLVLRNISQSCSAFSASIIRKVTKTHFDLLYTIYTRCFSVWTATAAELQLASMSSADPLPPDAQIYHGQLSMMLNSALGVMEHLIDALHALSQDLLVPLANALLVNFQVALDARLALQPILGPGLAVHLKQYGQLLLRIQACRPTLIGRDVLQAYTLVLQHVYQRVVGPDGVDTDMECFRPLLVQAFRLLSSHLDCWHATEPLWQILPAEAQTLAALVQPFLQAPAEQDENSASVDGTDTDTDTDSFIAKDKSDPTRFLDVEDADEGYPTAGAVSKQALVLLRSLKASFPEELEHVSLPMSSDITYSLEF